MNLKASDFYVNIEIFDVYSIATRVVEFDAIKRFFDVYIDIFLESANGLNKPLVDCKDNKFLLRVTFKTTYHYSEVDLNILRIQAASNVIKPSGSLSDFATFEDEEVESILSSEEIPYSSQLTNQPPNNI